MALSAVKWFSQGVLSSSPISPVSTVYCSWFFLTEIENYNKLFISSLPFPHQSEWAQVSRQKPIYAFVSWIWIRCPEAFKLLLLRHQKKVSESGREWKRNRKSWPNKLTLLAEQRQHGVRQPDNQTGPEAVALYYIYVFRENRQDQPGRGLGDTTTGGRFKWLATKRRKMYLLDWCWTFLNTLSDRQGTLQKGSDL